MEFNFDNEHIDGIKNVVADYFSRVKPEEPEILAMWYQPHNTAENRLQLIEKCHSWVWAPTNELGKVVLSYDQEYIMQMINIRQTETALPDPAFSQEYRPQHSREVNSNRNDKQNVGHSKKHSK
jgi:hypothetical protein